MHPDEFESFVAALNIVCSFWSSYSFHLILEIVVLIIFVIWIYFLIWFLFFQSLQAIIWFHLHDYAKTVSVLEPLFQKIDPSITDVCHILFDDIFF
jgi:hypothetical protein